MVWVPLTPSHTCFFFSDLGGWTTIQQSDEELVEERNVGAQTDPLPLPETIQVGRVREFNVDLDQED